nr:hypothetical protein [Tanacetum cinerariifolium]GEY12936.1 hypothetical protein [Tanacetum cinerariifolium]
GSYRSDELRFEVFFDSCFFFYSLEYPGGQILDLRLPRSKRLSYKEMNDHLLDKTKDDIWKWFYCKPKCSLEKGPEEAHSPSYLRSPHVWQRTSYINGKSKVLLDEFEAIGNEKDKVAFDALDGKCKDMVPSDDSKDRLISTKGDGEQTLGSSSRSNLY